jgi:hypothetical protein
MELTQNKIEAIIQNIRQNKEFRRSFIKIANEIVDKIYSLVENENCTCVKVVREWITNEKNKTAIDSLLEEYKTLMELTTQQPSIPNLSELIPNAPNVSKSVIGDVFEIEPFPNEYKKLIKTSISEKWLYRGINIVQTTNKDGKNVWLVLFY